MKYLFYVLCYMLYLAVKSAMSGSPPLQAVKSTMSGSPPLHQQFRHPPCESFSSRRRTSGGDMCILYRAHIPIRRLSTCLK